MQSHSHQIRQIYLWMFISGLFGIAVTSTNSAYAGGAFSVSPVRIYMAATDRATAVTLVNEGDSPVALQADLNTWAQKADGTDELTPTEDLILSPPIIKLAPKSRQVVRLVLLGEADASRQLTYRLIVKEIPEAANPTGNTIDIPIALALSMPIFITPPSAKREITCTLAQKNGKAQAECGNSGNAYAQIREVVVQKSGQAIATFKGGAYILPGAHRSIELKAQTPLPKGPAELTVTFDDGQSQTYPATL